MTEKAMTASSSFTEFSLRISSLPCPRKKNENKQTSKWIPAFNLGIYIFQSCSWECPFILDMMGTTLVSDRSWCRTKWSLMLRCGHLREIIKKMSSNWSNERDYIKLLPNRQQLAQTDDCQCFKSQNCWTFVHNISDQCHNPFLPTDHITAFFYSQLL